MATSLERLIAFHTAGRAESAATLAARNKALTPDQGIAFLRALLTRPNSTATFHERISR